MMNFEILGYSLLSGVLPALLWLWFWIREDNLHPEPRKLITFTFIAGALSVIVALYVEYIIGHAFSCDSCETTRYILWAAAEEIVKIIAVTIVALSSVEMDEPIDAMIYCITVALGFAALENALFIFSQLNTGDIINSIISGDKRFIGPMLVHVVSSASIGFMIGLAFYKNIFVKIISAGIGIAIAITLHASFNLSIIKASDMGTLKVFGWVWGAIVILLILFEEIKVVKPKAEKIPKKLLETKL